MGNRISHRSGGDDASLKMSNGATGVLLSVLLLAGSDRAETQWERDLMRWLAEHDQHLFGIGCVGFDLDEIAWRREDFDAQKEFVLRVIDAARGRHRWTTLLYDPPHVGADLDRLRELVVRFTEADIADRMGWAWRFDGTPDAGLCEDHQVYVHEHGCLICNDFK